MSGERQRGKRTTLAAWEQLKAAAELSTSRSTNVAAQIQQEKREQKKIDGRTLRKTGRTEQLNVRVKSGTKKEIERIAGDNGWLIAETIEHAIAALQQSLRVKA